MTKKIISFLTILTLAICCSFNVLAEEYPIMPLWFEEDTNLLNSTQQKYVCDNWDFVNSFDTIWYYTDSQALCFGNYYRYDSSSSAPYRFNNLYWLKSDGTFARKNAADSGVNDSGNLGAVYKSNGAFELKVDNMNMLNNCVVQIPPNLDLPTPNAPNISTNTQQSDYIASISSPVTSGSVINYFRYDVFNIYAVHSTAYDNSIGGSSDLVIKYKQDSTGRYLIPVYDHSEVVIYGSNLTISTSGLQITPSLYSGVSYSFPNSNGIIQRDVNRFDYTYVDLQMLNQYPFESLPFSNSNNNTGKVDYLGQQTSVRSGGTGSRSIMLEFNGKNYSTSFYIVITDSFKDIEQAKQESNQTIINNNINNNFNELDNTLQHGNQQSQQSNSSLNNNNNLLNNTINDFNQIDNNANQNFINDLNNIPMNQYELNGIQKLTNASNFVKVQFDNLTNGNPIGISIGFGLIVGLGLLLLARRL